MICFEFESKGVHLGVYKRLQLTHTQNDAHTSRHQSIHKNGAPLLYYLHVYAYFTNFWCILFICKS